MQFILRMAYREIRASWHRLLFFFLCIAIGVGSIISLRSIVQNIRESVSQQAQALLTADIQISSGMPLNQDARAIIDRHRKPTQILATSESIEMPTMARAIGNDAVAPKQVEVRAVRSEFPFYGEMVLSNGQKYDFNLLRNRGIIVRPALLQQLGIGVGDAVKIGSLEFTIRGVVEREPGNSLNAFSFGPRVFASLDDIVEAGLTGFGSRVRYRLLLMTAPGTAEKLTGDLKAELKSQPLVSIRSYRDAENRVAETFTQVENFLSLIGLIILVLGGIGISSVTRVFIQQKMKTIAVLKCLGGRNSRVLGAYLVQVMAMGLIGSLFGALLAKVTVVALPAYLADRIPSDIPIHLTWPAILQGLGIGLLISILFASLPLLEIRNIKPILVLRAIDPPAGRKRWDALRIGVAGVVVLALIALAAWQAGSLKVGAIFLAGLGATALILNLSAWALIRAVRNLRHIKSFPLRQGINSLYRPGNQTRVILLAVGLGAFFIISVRLLQANLLEEFDLNLGSNSADMYLIDIQVNQKEAIFTALSGYLGKPPDLVPTLRARIVEINGKPINSDLPERQQNRGMMSRDYVVTYRDGLEQSEKVVEGEFWPATAGTEPEISIEELVRDELKVKPGDSMTFDLAGNRVKARISNVRRVDWRNSRIGFLIVFRRGALDELSQQMLITAVKAPADSAQRVKFQRGILDKFPNVSVIDVRDIIEAASRVISTVSTAVTFVGGFVFLSGLLILIGSIAMTKYHRLYESAILKTLGAKKALIAMITLVEYGVLGAIAGMIGTAGAAILSFLVCKYSLEISWSFMPLANLTGMLVTIALVTTIGVLSSWDVMVRKPLGILKAE